MTDAERLASLLWPEVFNRPFHDVARAQRAIDAGWTPPPDPADVVARRLSIAEGSGGIWQPDNSGAQRRLLATVRDLFTPEALAHAAAKMHEADA